MIKVEVAEPSRAELGSFDIKCPAVRVRGGRSGQVRVGRVE